MENAFPCGSTATGTGVCCALLLWSLFSLGFPGGSDGKASACKAGDPGSIPGLGRSLEKEMAIYSSILAWKIPWMEEPGRLQSMWSQRVGHDFTFIFILSAAATAAAAKSLQSCSTLCNPINGSPAGSPIPGILQARTLEWVAISFSNA